MLHWVPGFQKVHTWHHFDLFQVKSTIPWPLKLCGRQRMQYRNYILLWDKQKPCSLLNVNLVPWVTEKGEKEKVNLWIWNLYCGPSGASWLCSFQLWLPTHAFPNSSNHVSSHYLHWETLSDSFLPATTQILSLLSLPGSVPCRVWDKLLADQGNTVFPLQGNLKATHLALFLAFHFSLSYVYNKSQSPSS